MAKGYNPTEYIYSSARIRALETRIATRERIYHLADAESSAQVVSQLEDMGFDTSGGTDGAAREDMLDSLLVKGYAEIASMECSSAIAFMRYQYDANNIKALIKSAARGVSPESMLSTLGTVELSVLNDAFSKKDYAAFPKNIEAAIHEAEEAFASTKNPQKIDFIIDRACFADMREAAEASGIELAKKLVVAKIDQTNIMITLRVLQMKLGMIADSVLSEAYIEGGSFSLDELKSALAEGEDALARCASGAGYTVLGDAIVEREMLGSLEKKVDDLWLNRAKDAKHLIFGAEVAIGYIAALEYVVKNVRIILAGKDAGLAPERIRERLRDCYV